MGPSDSETKSVRVALHVEFGVVDFKACCTFVSLRLRLPGEWIEEVLTFSLEVALFENEVQAVCLLFTVVLYEQRASGAFPLFARQVLAVPAFIAVALTQEICQSPEFNAAP